MTTFLAYVPSQMERGTQIVTYRAYVQKVDEKEGHSYTYRAYVPGQMRSTTK